MEPKYIYFLLSYSKTDIRQLVSVTLFSRSLANTKKNFPVERLTEKKGGGGYYNQSTLYTVQCTSTIDVIEENNIVFKLY